jgi:hypothetical protein
MEPSAAWLAPSAGRILNRAIVGHKLPRIDVTKAEAGLEADVHYR